MKEPQVISSLVIYAPNVTIGIWVTFKSYPGIISVYHTLINEFLGERKARTFERCWICFHREHWKDKVVYTHTAYM